MSKRSTARVAALAAVLSGTLALAGPALGARGSLRGGPKPLSPSVAYSLATAPPSSGVGTPVAVSGATALAASSLPGSTTWVDPQLSPSMAAGVDATTSRQTACWANAAWHQWGTWPYQQRIIDTTYWCAVYGSHITYRSSSTTTSGTLCGTGWRANQLVGGGVGSGFTYFITRASAGFSCPTVIPWVTIHTSHYEDIRRGYRGGTTFVGLG